MINNGIQFDALEATRTITELTAKCSSLNQTLYEIKKLINVIIDFWDSPSGNEFSESFQMIVPDFENASKFITKYANFLNLTIETYEETEKRISKSASSFLD